jgi:hypothetical protein
MRRIMADIRPVLREIFNQDFSSFEDPDKFRRAFFAKNLTITDLKKIANLVLGSQASAGGQVIPDAIAIPGNRKQAPFIILAQLHGNEPAGLAGIALAMALSQAGKLERDVIGVIGNPVAAQQYFEAWSAAPTARQETRDAYRSGLDEQGNLLPDMNRIPVDFKTQDASNPHIKRAQELYVLAEQASGILDIHSARGDMVCVTDYKHEKHLKHSPIRRVLTHLAEAIAAHASGVRSVRTFKTTIADLNNIQCQVGIEAGRHESPTAPQIAASFTLSLFYTLGLTKVTPLVEKETGQFERYEVKPRITYADLVHSGKLTKDDQVYMVLPCSTIEEIPKQAARVVVENKDKSLALQTALEHIIKPAGKLRYALHQYDEMEAIKKNQVVAVALPSGVEFKAPQDFSGIFLSKSSTLYTKDPAVGPWPVPADKLASVKFCYPCDVSKWRIDFKG